MLEILHCIGIFPHDGKRVIYIKDGKFHSGSVIGSSALTGVTDLSELDEAERLKEIVEAANALRVPPFKIERKLEKGKIVIFRDSHK